MDVSKDIGIGVNRKPNFRAILSHAVQITYKPIEHMAKFKYREKRL